MYKGTEVSGGVSNKEGILFLEIPFDEDEHSYREVRNLSIEDKSFLYEGIVSVLTSTPFVIDLGPQLSLESFSFGMDEGEFYIEAFLVNRGTEPARAITAELEDRKLKIISERSFLFDKLEIGQKEPVIWRFELPKEGVYSIPIRIDGENFPAISKSYIFERGENWVRPVILAQEYFEGEENQFSFWVCTEEGCFKSDEPFRIEEKEGDMAVRAEGRSFALMNTIYGENFVGLDILLERGSANVNFRSRPLHESLTRYFVTISAKSIALTKQTDEGFVVLAQETTSLSFGEWQTLGISHKEGSIAVFLNESQVLEYFDEDFLEAGVISIEALPDSVIWFDDVVLKGKKNVIFPESNLYLSWIIIFAIPVAIFLLMGNMGRRIFRRAGKAKENAPKEKTNDSKII